MIIIVVFFLKQMNSKFLEFLFKFCLCAVLPVMLSTKLLPEMEVDDNSKREQLLFGMQNLPVASQIERLKVIRATHTIPIICISPFTTPFHGFLI